MTFPCKCRGAQTPPRVETGRAWGHSRFDLALATLRPRVEDEREARRRIDDHLAEAGWVVQDRREMNLAAGRGVAVREYPLATGHGFADYLLFVDEPADALLARVRAERAAAPIVATRRRGGRRRAPR